MALDQALKEFDEKFGNEHAGCDGCTASQHQAEEIKSFLISFYRSLLTEDIERLEGKKEYCDPHRNTVNDCDDCNHFSGKNSVINTEISHKKQLLKELE